MMKIFAVIAALAGAVKVGDTGTYYGRSQGTHPGIVVAVHDDGTVDVKTPSNGLTATKRTVESSGAEGSGAFVLDTPGAGGSAGGSAATSAATSGSVAVGTKGTYYGSEEVPNVTVREVSGDKVSLNNSNGSPLHNKRDGSGPAPPHVQIKSSGKVGDRVFVPAGGAAPSTTPSSAPATSAPAAGAPATSAPAAPTAADRARITELERQVKQEREQKAKLEKQLKNQAKEDGDNSAADQDGSSDGDIDVESDARSEQAAAFKALDPRNLATNRGVYDSAMVTSAPELNNFPNASQMFLEQQEQGGVAAATRMHAKDPINGPGPAATPESKMDVLKDLTVAPELARRWW